MLCGYRPLKDYVQLIMNLYCRNPNIPMPSFVKNIKNEKIRDQIIEGIKKYEQNTYKRFPSQDKQQNEFGYDYSGDPDNIFSYLITIINYHTQQKLKQPRLINCHFLTPIDEIKSYSAYVSQNDDDDEYKQPLTSPVCDSVEIKQSWNNVMNTGEKRYKWEHNDVIDFQNWTFKKIGNLNDLLQDINQQDYVSKSLAFEYLNGTQCQSIQFDELQSLLQTITVQNAENIIDKCFKANPVRSNQKTDIIFRLNTDSNDFIEISHSDIKPVAGNSWQWQIPNSIGKITDKIHVKDKGVFTISILIDINCKCSIYVLNGNGYSLYGSDLQNINDLFNIVGIIFKDKKVSTHIIANLNKYINIAIPNDEYFKLASLFGVDVTKYISPITGSRGRSRNITNRGASSFDYKALYIKEVNKNKQLDKYYKVAIGEVSALRYILQQYGIPAPISSVVTEPISIDNKVVSDNNKPGKPSMANKQNSMNVSNYMGKKAVICNNKGLNKKPTKPPISQRLTFDVALDVPLNCNISDNETSVSSSGRDLADDNNNISHHNGGNPDIITQQRNNYIDSGVSRGDEDDDFSGIEDWKLIENRFKSMNYQQVVKDIANRDKRNDASINIEHKQNIKELVKIGASRKDIVEHTINILNSGVTTINKNDASLDVKSVKNGNVIKNDCDNKSVAIDPNVVNGTVNNPVMIYQAQHYIQNQQFMTSNNNVCHQFHRSQKYSFGNNDDQISRSQESLRHYKSLKDSFNQARHIDSLQKYHDQNVIGVKHANKNIFVNSFPYANRLRLYYFSDCHLMYRNSINSLYKYISTKGLTMKNILIHTFYNIDNRKYYQTVIVIDNNNKVWDSYKQDGYDMYRTTEKCCEIILRRILRIPKRGYQCKHCLKYCMKYLNNHDPLGQRFTHYQKDCPYLKEDRWLETYYTI